MIEPQIAVGTSDDYDFFLENSTFHIRQLYNHLLENDETKLYSNITSGVIEPSRPICNKVKQKKMIYHAGQMGGEYPLSPSQREAISCFQEIEEGDVLAVNGPPGTGKTTLLQTIVANMYVQAAIAKADAPVIIATSTNNQAVTNIIDSFGKINPIGIRNLESRWITGVHSFAVYFPSKGRMKEAQRNNYQYTSVNGIAFAEDIESDDNRKKAKELFQKEFYGYFGKRNNTLENAKNYIHAELIKIEEQRAACIKNLIEVKSIIGNQTSGEYILGLTDQISSIDEQINRLIAKQEEIKQNGEKLVKRCIEWRESYNSLPWYIKVFKCLPCFKKKIVTWSYQNMNYDELDFLERGMSIEEIENQYHQEIQENDKKFRNVKEEMVP